MVLHKNRALRDYIKIDRTRVKTHFQTGPSKHLLCELLRKVSGKALEMIYQQINLAAEPTNVACKGAFTATWGLPCRHTLVPFLRHRRPIPMALIHRQWHLDCLSFLQPIPAANGGNNGNEVEDSENGGDDDDHHDLGASDPESTTDDDDSDDRDGGNNRVPHEAPPKGVRRNLGSLPPGMRPSASMAAIIERHEANLPEDAVVKRIAETISNGARAMNEGQRLTLLSRLDTFLAQDFGDIQRPATITQGRGRPKGSSQAMSSTVRNLSHFEIAEQDGNPRKRPRCGKCHRTGHNSRTCSDDGATREAPVASGSGSSSSLTALQQIQSSSDEEE
ncbi:hypothetical protein HDU96_010692 [Phlyctochytrium bullatum]|nr:hypothetical protein HDU96_010692 [Phlyctochytrium bullatum]